MDMNKEIVIKFYEYMSDGLFDKMGEFMDQDAKVWLPNTREVFRGRNKYIDFNKKYPDKWKITIEKIYSMDDLVTSAVKVESEDKLNSFYNTAFFKIKGNLIEEITEYWGDNAEPPIWRVEEGLAERY
jgi:hypothetical protein